MSNGSLFVHGRLIANGTPDTPVVFTSLKDDAYGGDTNGDGTASAPAVRDWTGIGFSGTSTGNILNNVVVRYGGYAYYTGTTTWSNLGYSSNLTIATSDLHLTNSTVTDGGDLAPFSGTGAAVVINGASPVIEGNLIARSGGYGLLIRGSTAAPSICGNRVLDNTGDGVRADSGAMPLVIGNEIARNDGYGIHNTSPSTKLAAEWNYWGAESGPFDASDDRTVGGLYNPGGSGDDVSDHVDYDPWLTFAPAACQLQPVAGQDLPAEQVALDHLWQWEPDSGRFVDPGPNGVTIDPDKPTYLLTHGWDGQLNGNRCGTLPDDATCAALSSPDDKPHFAMSSVGGAIYRATQESGGANIWAWDWADAANPNRECDIPEQVMNLDAFVAVLGGRDIRRVPPTNSVLFDAWYSALNAGIEGPRLGTKLAEQFRLHGSLGSRLHLIGKSHGGGVLGGAGKRLRILGHAPETLTTLDTPRVGSIDSLQFVSADSVADDGRLVVLYYSDRLKAGMGAGLLITHPNLTNIALNSVYVPDYRLTDPTNPRGFAHLWVSGLDDCECEAPWSSLTCPPNDGWFPLNAWDDDSGASPILRFLPPTASPAYSLLDVADFPAGNWEERDPYTFVSLDSGACCEGLFALCTEKQEVDCVGNGREYKGNGTTCADSDSNGHPDLCETTPPPTGACCSRLIPTGPSWCDQRTESWCTGLGDYEFHGEGSQCDTDGDGTFDICDSQAVTAGGEPAGALPNPTPGMSLLRLEPFQSAATWYGNLTQLVIGADPGDATNRVILMQEQGDGSFFKDIDWPGDASVVTFDYMFRELRGEENLTVYVDNQIVYYDNAETTLARGHLTSGGAIYVGNVAGRTARLNFVLRTDQPEGGQFGGELLIDNIRVYGFLEHDVDLDGDRDLLDFAALQRCFGASPIPDECWAFDVDGVDGVGLEDHHAMSEVLDDDKLGGPKLVGTP